MSNKELLEDIANKRDDEETDLGAKPTIHEGIKNLDSIQTKTDINSETMSDPTKTCVTDIITPQTNEENILENTAANSSMEDFTKLSSEKEIIQEIDALFDVSSSEASRDLTLKKSGNGDIVKNTNLDDSLDITIKNGDEPPESNKQAPNSHTEVSNTDDKIIDSDTEKVDEGIVLNIQKPVVEKAINKNTSDNEIDAEKEINNPVVDNIVEMDETDTEMLVSDKVLTNIYEDKNINKDSLDSIDKIDGTEIADATEQNSDSNEDMLLRWDDEDEDEQIESTNDNQADDDVAVSGLINTTDQKIKSPTPDKSSLKPAIETEISSTMDISDVAQTIDTEKFLKEDENLGDDVTDTIREDVAIKAHIDDVNSINKEPILKQSDATSAMEVDTVIPDADLNKEIQGSILSSQLKFKTTEKETKMDLDLSLAHDESITTMAVEEAHQSPEEKVDVHNPDTSVKEYSIDLSIVTGEVNGPERNADCHDLLQIKEQNQDSSLDDSIVANTEHGLNKPDVMLEIPTQELIDFDNSNVEDDDEIQTLDETVDGNANDIEQQVPSVETQENSDENRESKQVPKILKENQKIGNTVEPNEIDNHTKKLQENDKNKEMDSLPKGQVEQDKINKNDIQGTIQTVIESTKDGVKDKPLDSKKKTETKVDKPVEDIEESIESIAKEIEDQQKIIDAQPSTSTEMTPDTADEVPDVSDSLGLLAESSRVLEDDDDDDGFDDDGDGDDGFDDDESSNQMTAEHSEDSNAPPSESDAPQSESDVPKRQDEKEIETPPVENDGEFDFQSKGASKTEVGGKDSAPECEETISPEDTMGEESRPSDEETKQAVDNIMEKTTDQSGDIETVKLSDTSDNEADSEKKIAKHESNESSNQSSNKTKKLEIATQKNFVNIVDLEESSSEDDATDERSNEQPEEQPTSPADKDSVTSVNIPLGVEVMCTVSGAGGMSEMRHKGDEMIISGVPKPPPHKPARLNTSEVTIKTASTASTLVIPEIPKLGLEIFNIDSDEDSCSGMKDVSTASPKSDITEEIKETTKEKCINLACKSDGCVPFVPANASTVAFFNFKKKRRPIVCQNCADMVATRAQDLVEGIRKFTPILDLDAGKEPQELVEISDSESEDESEVVDEVKMVIGEKVAKFLEENLADMLNETWKKFKMDERLLETQELLSKELEDLENQTKEIDDIFNECQMATDKLRNELYSTFEGEKQELPALIIFDTPYSEFVLPEDQVTRLNSVEPRQSKRRLSSASEAAAPAKRAAIPLGYTPLDTDANAQHLPDKTPAPVDNSMKIDDDRDVSVVQLSAESAPADLPAPGDLVRAPIKAGMPVFAMRNAFGSWLKGKVLECQAKGTTSNQTFTMCRVKFEHKVKNPCKVLSARCLAYAEPAEVRMTIGTRVIALCRDSTNTGKKDSFYAGVVAEIPNPVNNYRYLVFFDDGYAQYVVHSDTRLVCECSHLVWEEVHPFSREFVRDYLLAYPERPMVRLHAGQSLKTEWNGKWWVSRVVVVDASLAQVQFDEDNRVEWIYRGSTRLAPLYLELQAAERTRARPLPRSKNQARSNMPYVEYTRTDEQGGNKTDEMQVQEQQQNEEMRRQRAVAKKSTATPVAPTPVNIAGNLDTVTSRVVYYTPKNAVRPLKMSAHTCGPKCKRTDVLALKELRTYNPLAKPLLSGWERQIVRFKGQKEVMYRAPCGRRVRDLGELHRYLRATRSDMPVDLFDFHPNTHCLAEFVLNKCNVGKKDLSHGKENVPVPCVNYYDDSLPEFCSYNTERTPTAGVPLNLDPDFLCGCDCTDDCADKSKCACWKLTLEGARTIGLEGTDVGYSYKRLPEPLPSGIYECNSRCKCKHTCLNRVAQHPLQLKLQVFKTLNRGWGIRALNDVPKGSFLCVYAGNLLTDATANLDGLNEGDEYLAELDYIEVVEQMKEGFEEDIPESIKKLDKKESKTDDKQTSSEETSSEEEEDTPDKNDVMDDDFSPGYIGPGLTKFSKRLRKRGKGKKGEKVEVKDNKEKDAKKDGNGDEECITISDDEEVRQPSRFTAQAGMGANEFVPKYRSVRAHFGKDEACYIMDAKVQGNIGRYLNHSCSPNVFVQNVFVDTHDPRFPWVAFFALSYIRAGTELTWNYNYDIGSVPEKVLYCFCGAPNCRRRLL